MKIINIVDTGCDRYTIKSDCDCLGRQWDNEAEEISVIIPEREIGNTCTMIVSADGVVIDHIDIKDVPKKITNVLSRNEVVEISFTFSNENGYVKNSEIRTFYFAEARKPEDFVPVEPEQTGKIDILLGNGIVRAVLDGNIIKFYNANGEKVQDLDLQGIVVAETDPTVPSWAKQPNKPTYNYNEIVGTPNIPNISGLASETYVNNKASTTLSESKSYTDTKISNLVGSAPSTLDTIGEIATALNNNTNVVTALNNSIATKQNSTDNTLQTSSKTIVGAINEINSKIGSANTALQNILGV